MELKGTAAGKPPADALVAHCREATAVLRARGQEQQARIEALEAHINRIVQAPENERKENEPIIQRLKRTLQQWVERAPAAAAEETGDDDYRKISSHDLWRCKAHHLLLNQGVLPRIVIALGGWSSYDAIEPYLAGPTEANTIDSMSDATL